MKKTLSFLLMAGFVFTAPVTSFGTDIQTEPAAQESAAVEEAQQAVVEEVAAPENTAEAGEETAPEDTAAAGAEAVTEDATMPETEAGSEGDDYTSGAEYVTLIDEPEKVSTSHSAMINGQQIDYTATVGSLVFSNGEGQCEMFYTAYTRDDVKDTSARPVTFAYNGGPGAGSAFVNLFFIGPRMIELDEEGNSVSLPPRIVDNEYSILDLTDLVVIDAVGTGYSRLLEGTDPACYYGVDQDAQTFGNFIWLYLNSTGRWSSPKYLLGESYGTIRSMAVCNYLTSAFSLPLNGLIQVSSVHDNAVLQDPMSDDSGYVRFLPTYAADAWYQKQLNETYQAMTIEDFLAQVRTFADSEYMSALNRGDSLSEEEFNAAAQKVSDYTGLDVNYVKLKKLRISMSDFCLELLKDQNLIVGRMDGRITGPVTGGSIGGGDNDPSFKDVMVELGAVTNQYYNDELDYHSDIPYLQMSSEVNLAWVYSGDSIFPFNQRDTIYSNICGNRFLKVWVLCGYYDLATPFHSAEWVYDHLYLNDQCKEQVQFTYYKGGHMFYLDKEDHQKFHQDAEAWFNS